MSVLLRAVAGLILWAIGFSLLYAVHGIGCARGWPVVTAWPVDLFRLTLLATWGATLAAGLWLVWRVRGGGGFGGRLALVGAVVGVISTLVTGMPVIVFPGCL